MALRLGTRGSALALAQSRTVADAVTAATGVPVELVEIVTAGDRSTAPIPQLGVGVFVSALRDALTAKEIDFAVHSYKDLPSAPADGLTIAAIPLRDDPRDALITRDGSRLAQRRPDLSEEQRGEVAHTVHRVVQRLLHSPTVRARQLAATPDGDQYAAVLREQFDLDVTGGDAGDLERAVGVEFVAERGA